MNTSPYRLSALTATILFMFGTAGIFAQEQKPEKRGDARVRSESARPEDGRRGRGNPHRQIQQMKEHLSLSDAQVKDIQGVFQKYRPKMEELRTKYQDSGDRQAARTEMMAFQQNIQKEINHFLTADQQKKWHQLQEQRRERMRQGQRSQRGERPAPKDNNSVKGPPPPKVNP